MIWCAVYVLRAAGWEQLRINGPALPHARWDSLLQALTRMGGTTALRLQLQVGGIGLPGPGLVAGMEAGIAQVEVGHRPRWIDLQGVFQPAHRFGIALLAVIDKAEVVGGLGKIRTQLERLGQLRHRLVIALLAVQLQASV